MIYKAHPLIIFQAHGDHDECQLLLGVMMNMAASFYLQGKDLKALEFLDQAMAEYPWFIPTFVEHAEVY